MAVEGGANYRQRLVNRQMRRSAIPKAKAKRELAFSTPAPMKAPTKPKASLFERLSFSPLFNTRLLGGMSEQAAQARNRANIIQQAAENPNLSRADRRNLQISAAMESPEVKGFVEEYGGSGVIGSVGRRTAGRVTDLYRSEVEDIAENIAKQAAQLAPFTRARASRAAEQLATTGRAIVHPDIMSQILGQSVKRREAGGGPARFVIGPESVRDIAQALEDPDVFAEIMLGGRLGSKISQQDLPSGINIGDIGSVLGLGRGAPLVGKNRGYGDVEEIRFLAATEDLTTPAGTRMFKKGAETGKEIATTINPNFRGEFRATALTPETARSQIDLLQEVRGGIPVLRSGKVIDLKGNKIDSLSKRLYNAHDHAVAKAREAATQAIEQRIADALNIQLSDEFLLARQKRLDFVNNPNENDVLVDFLANSGKGGVGLSDLPKYLQKQLDSADITPHQRTAYRQMLGDILGGRYREIESNYRAITNQVDDPLKGVISPKFRDEFGDAVDSLRRRLRSNKDEDLSYNQEQFDADLAILGDAVERVARSSKGRITFAAVKKASGLQF